MNPSLNIRAKTVPWICLYFMPIISFKKTQKIEYSSFKYSNSIFFYELWGFLAFHATTNRCLENHHVLEIWILKCMIRYMLLRLHITLRPRTEILILIWQIILQLNLIRRWFQNIFIFEVHIDFVNESQSKLKLILSLLIIANLFAFLDTVHQDILFHARVQFWKWAISGVVIK